MTAALLAALIMIESGGNDLAIGDAGRAIGPLQIHAAVVADVNRIAGTRLLHSQMTNRQAAMWVCAVYVNHYATPERIGRPVTDEDRARCWNGGPIGWKKPATKQYWTKVRRHMK